MSQSPPTSTPPPGAASLWGSHSGSGARVPAGALTPPGGSSGGERLEPLSRRLLQLAGLLSLLLLAVLANSFVNGGESPLDLNPVAMAAEQTQEAAGARFSMKVVYSSEGEPPTAAHGGGAYNGETGVAQTRLRLSDPTGRRIEVESLSDGSTIYVRSPQFPGKVPEGKEWLSYQPLLGQAETSMMPGESPAACLRMLAASGAIDRLGVERVRGTRTTRYRANVSLTAFAAHLRSKGEDEAAEDLEAVAAQFLGPIRTEAWIDAQGVARRVRTVITSLSDGAPMTMDMRIDLFDFGARPEIQLPDSSQVFDMTPLVEDQLDPLS
ncbi:MAG TPA: hypothetical protein VN179_01900 [Solirubrobacterales bacterium]|nr:hypothetical protein [Solirubrobacterales bacterium]